MKEHTSRSTRRSDGAGQTSGENIDGPIPRGEHARRRILRAALQVLAEHGSAGFTMEAVARQAGASKATVYRHWRSPGALMVDAMDQTFQPFPAPEVGRLRDAVIRILTDQVTMLGEQRFPQVMAAFIDAAERNPELAGMHADLTGRRREVLLQVLRAALDRGEIDPSTDLEVAVDLFTAPFFYRRFIAHRPIPPEMVTDVADRVLAAIGVTPPASR